MNHVSDIKLKDLLLGPFFCQISSRFNQALYLGSAFYIAHREWKVLHGNWDIVGTAMLSSMTVLNVITILGLVFLMTCGFAVYSATCRRGVVGRREYQFRDNEFVEKTELCESTFKYTSIERVFMLCGAIYIGLPGMNWQILPRRDFASSTEWEALYSFLKTRVAGKPAALPTSVVNA